MKIDVKDLAIACGIGMFVALVDSLVRATKREFKAEDKAEAFEKAFASTKQELDECKAKLAKYES